jgi:hypothetical protein
MQQKSEREMEMKVGATMEQVNIGLGAAGSVRYAARTGQNGHEHSVSARLDAVFTEL